MTLPFFCARCGKYGEGPIWRKVKVWRVDLKAWKREMAPLCPDCGRPK